MATLIMTARLSNIDPRAWLADVFARMADMPQSPLHELWPWNWTLPASAPLLRRRNHARRQSPLVALKIMIGIIEPIIDIPIWPAGADAADGDDDRDSHGFRGPALPGPTIQSPGLGCAFKVSSASAIRPIMSSNGGTSPKIMPAIFS